MKKNPANLLSAAELRQQAEAKLRENETQTPAELSPEKTRQMLHELQIYQIELEMQNEELRRVQLELEDARTRYYELYDLAPVGYLVISEQGLILEANLTAARLLRVARGALVRQPLSNFILPQDQDIYYLHRKRLFETGEPQSCTLKLLREETPFSAEIEVVVAQSAAGAPICRMVIKDITERKQAEEALRESRAIIEAAMDQSSAGIAIADAPDGTLRFVNDAGLLIRGGDRQSIVDSIGINQYVASWQLFDLDGRPLRTDEVPLARAVMFGETNSREFVVRRDGNDDRIVVGNAAPIKDESGKVVAAIVVFDDITERKQAEIALESQRFLFEQVLEQSLAGYWDWMIQDKTEYLSPTFKRMFGYADHELPNLPETWQKLIFPEDLPGVFEVFDRHVASHGREPYYNEIRYHHKNGSTVWVICTGKVIQWDAENRPVRMIGCHIDITERKQAEAALLESEANYKTLADSGRVLIWTAGRDKLCDYFNQPWLDFTGRSFEQEAGNGWAEGVHPEDFQRCFKIYTDSFDQRESFSMEYRLRRADGEYRWILDDGCPRYSSNGEFLGYIGYCFDITERKQAEAVIEKRIFALTQPLESGSLTFADLFNLDEVQRIQDSLAQATGVASIITQIDGTPITAPSNFTNLCSEIIRKTEKGCANCFKSDAALGRYHPGGPLIQQCLSGGLWDAGVAITVGDRHLANWLIGQVRNEAQTQEKMQGYAREIGVDEAAFMAAFYAVPSMSREQFEQVAQALFRLANQLSTSAYQNVQQARFIAQRDRAELELQHSISDLKALYENGLAISALREPREIGQKVIETLSNNLAWHHIAIRLLHKGTNELELIAYNLPNLGEENIADVEKRLSVTLSKIGQGLSGRSVEIGQAIRSGNVQKEPNYVETYPGIHSGIYMPLNVGERVIGCIAVESEAEYAFSEQDERLLATLAGQAALAFENLRLYQDLRQELQERELAAQALSESEERFRALFENSIEGIALHEMVFNEQGEPVDYIFLMANPGFETHTGLHIPDILGKPVTQIYPGIEKTDLIKVYGQVTLTGEPVSFETFVEPTQKYYSVTAYQVGKGRFAAVFENITERKRAEEALHASLAEKETLLKEVHHRVKNNLASINGLISLQQNLLTDLAVISEFDSLSGRIHSMALVHELLYQSETLSRIELNGYFEMLASQIRASYDPLARVHLMIAAAGVEMELDNAIPCGLIVNELVTNTFKYAFPKGKPRSGQQECEIRVTADWDGSAYTLTVCDNGVGLPAGFDWATSKSLGLQLVMLLGQRQLKGQVELDHTAGLAFKLRFVPKR